MENDETIQAVRQAEKISHIGLTVMLVVAGIQYFAMHILLHWQN